MVRKALSLLAVPGVASLALASLPAQATYIDPSIAIATQLLSFGSGGINGDVFLPLTGAGTTSTLSGAPTATVDGYGWVKSNISISLSTGTPSTGAAYLGLPYPAGPGGGTSHGCFLGASMAGNANTGDTVCVSSFFDVFYDVMITDIDGTAGYFGGAGPAAMGAAGLGPINMQFNGDCVADTSKPNLGCLPPVGSPYIGHFLISMALGQDVNLNGFLDVIKFEFGTHNVGDVTNSFFNGNQLVDTFNSTIAGNGAVMDAITDPPFTFTLTGPTTAQQGIVYAADSIPEPASLALLGLARRRAIT
ncbi:MAG: hypothetical protein Q8Q28_10745 [Pseudomonadota bacterium]|nr:hypothetical protein [Pseudomonadota bacterium]